MGKIKKTKNDTPPYPQWASSMKARCVALYLTTPPESELKREYEAERNKDHYTGMGYRIKVARNLDQMPYRDVQQMVSQVGNTFAWIEIKRIDGEPVTSWEDKQAIKDAVVGKDHEGVELFPGRLRQHNEGNSCHLWVLKQKNGIFPFGFPMSNKQASMLVQNASDYE